MNKPIFIDPNNELGDIKVVGAYLKLIAGDFDDDKLETYTKSLTEATKLLEDIGKTTVTNGSPDKLQDSGQAIIFRERFISLEMTKDDYHGHQFHLSLVEIGMQGMQLARPEESKFILNAFFTTWKSIPNPGKMLSILHFVGNG